MVDWKFGDMVTVKRESGTYMVVGPYLGRRGASDDKGPAVWIADIDTVYMRLAGENTTTWAPVNQLEPVDE